MQFNRRSGSAMADQEIDDVMTRPGVSEEIKIVLRALKEFHNRGVRDNDRKHDENTKRLDTAIRQLDELSKGFPNGDAIGHRRYHEAQIEAAEEKRRMYAEIRLKFATASAWALVIFLGGLLMRYAKEIFTP